MSASPKPPFPRMVILPDGTPCELIDGSVRTDPQEQFIAEYRHSTDWPRVPDLKVAYVTAQRHAYPPMPPTPDLPLLSGMTQEAWVAANEEVVYRERASVTYPEFLFRKVLGQYRDGLLTEREAWLEANDVILLSARD